MIIDATCAPQNIKYPQDINLLNEAREKLEKLIKKICKEQNWYVPRMYRKNARKDYLALAKCRKRSAKKVRSAIKKQLNYVYRDLGYVEWFLEQDNVEFSAKDAAMLDVIYKVYEQQLYMYENKTHSVEDRIVSISQPYIRPIVRGKAKAPTEFGAKLDLSIDEYGMARLEKLSFDAYNESDILITALENYRKRTGHYPERVLADQIYRNRDNINFCKKWHIRLSGKALGRPKKTPVTDKKTEYQDNVDRIEVERKFSLAKRKFGFGLIRTKLENTTKSSILLAIIAMNVDRLTSLLIRWLFWVLLRILLQWVVEERLDIVHRLGRVGGQPVRDVAESHAVGEAAEVRAHLAPEALRDRVGDAGLLLRAVIGKHRAVKRVYHVPQSDLLRGARERVAAVRALNAADNVRLPQLREYLFEILRGDVLPRGDVYDRHNAVV